MKGLVPRFRSAIDGDASLEQAAEAVDALLTDAVHARATDVHLDPDRKGLRIRIRIDGMLYDAAAPPPEVGAQLVRQLQVRAGIDAATRPDIFDGHTRVDVDGKPVNFRIASIPSLFGDKLSVRILDPSRAPLEIGSLGLDPGDEQLLRDRTVHASGMFLSTGPTGSGKTTTLYAVLAELAKQHRNIISLEDPVELAIEEIVQVEVERANVPSFADGLVRLLRHDPDVLAIGEIRDSETARIAIDAALSGHAMLSSLSARDVAGAVSLLRNLGVRDDQISAAVRLVIGQRTVRLLCSECREPRALNEAQKAILRSRNEEPLEESWECPGCDNCLGTGHTGIAAVFEVWAPDDAGYQLIVDHADEKRIRSHIRECGVRSLGQRAMQLVRCGKIALPEALWLDGPKRAP